MFRQAISRFAEGILNSPFTEVALVFAPAGVQRRAWNALSALSGGARYGRRGPIAGTGVVVKTTAMIEGDLYEGTVEGVNIMRGDVKGGALLACNTLIGDVVGGEISAVNVMHGDVRSGRVWAVNALVGDIHGGDVASVNTIYGNVYGGTVQASTLVGDVIGGNATLGRQVHRRRE